MYEEMDDKGDKMNRVVDVMPCRGHTMWCRCRPKLLDSGVSSRRRIHPHVTGSDFTPTCTRCSISGVAPHAPPPASLSSICRRRGEQSRQSRQSAEPSVLRPASASSTLEHLRDKSFSMAKVVTLTVTAASRPSPGPLSQLASLCLRRNNEMSIDIVSLRRKSNACLPSTPSRHF
jgi:hypothetical protein